MKVRIQFDRLRDYLYVIMRVNAVVSSLSFYKGKFWSVWYWDASNQFHVLSCSEVIDADIIEFNVNTGKYKAVSKITIKPHCHYFVVVRPTEATVIDDAIREEGLRRVTSKKKSKND